MPELYQDVQEKPVTASTEEADLVGKLMEYTEPTQNPWRDKYISITVAECYNFKELRQWSSDDSERLGLVGVPTIAVDRVNRGLDTIRGIRDNTGSAIKVIKRELGDDRVSELLDLCYKQVHYQGDFDGSQDEAFDSLLDVGLGVQKVGFDPKARGGDGEIWKEFVPVEDFWYSRCKKKTLDDIGWAVHRQMMSWDEAMQIEPSKAGELKGLRTQLETAWNEHAGGNTKGNLSRDYGRDSAGNTTVTESYPNQVYLWEFWIARRIPVVKVLSIQSQQNETGELVGLAPVITEQPIDYKPQETEQIVASAINTEWHQYIIATGKDKKGGILLKHAIDDDHPFIGMCAEKKKSGEPRGYVEIVIPHQKRINIAWAQKVAYNNKSIKTPIVTYNVTDTGKVIQQSAIGAVLALNGTEKADFPNPPGVSLQAIEEGNVARADMDFAAAATEMPLRGASQPGTSGIKLSLEQNAAITPLNKWVKAERESKIVLGRKVLRLIIKHFSPEKIARIVGWQKFNELVLMPKIDRVTGEVLAPPLGYPLDISAVDYDVTIEDQAISDFNKQQAFNATEALVAGGVPLDDEYRIRNAPIKNTDEALASNQKARQDIMQAMALQIQMLQDEVGQLKKQAPKGEGNQRGNAVTGKSAPQAGRRSMVGGQLGIPG